MLLFTMTKTGRAVHRMLTKRSDVRQITSGEAQQLGLIPYTGNGGLRTVKALTYNGSELILGDKDIPNGAIAYVAGEKVRVKPFDYVPVQFYSVA